jgi:thioredoxin-like negative regulator of GroEL
MIIKKFYADWCEPCGKMDDKLQKLQQELGFSVVDINVDNIDSLPELLAEGVRIIPLLVAENGSRLEGEKPMEVIREFVQSAQKAKKEVVRDA